MRETDERLLAKHRRLFGERAYRVINGKSMLSYRLRREGRYEEALNLSEQVLVQQAERYGPNHRRTRETRLAVAVTLIKLSRAEEAKEILSGDLIPACVRVRGEAGDETQRCRLWLVKALVDLGDYAAAQRQLSAIFDATKARGRWWDPEAEGAANDFWWIVTTEDPPD